MRHLTRIETTALRREIVQGIAIIVLVSPSQQVSTAKSSQANQWPHEGPRCTSTAPARSAQRSLCPAGTGRGPLRGAAPRSAGRPGSSRRRGRRAGPGSAGRLSLSLSVPVMVVVAAAGQRSDRGSQSRSRGRVGAAVSTGLGGPSWHVPSSPAAARWTLRGPLARRSGGRMAAGRSAQWQACTGDLWECEYMCFVDGGMCLRLAFAAVGHGQK
jgi:hypothetical protein